MAGGPGDGKERPTSFYVAIFLTLLLFVSAGLNVVLLIVALFSSAASGLGGSVAGPSDQNFDVVSVGGDKGAEARILRVSIEGAIAEEVSPLIGAMGGTVSTVERNLRLASRDDKIKAVLLDINSPGGGVTASDRIHRMIVDFREETGKPVLSLFGDVAASGGYYIAAPCDRILARPTTITGSIGVIIQTLDYSDALDKIGVSQRSILDPRTPYKDMLSPSKKATEKEIEIVRSIVSEMYERFVTVVDEGRPSLDREQVIDLADGRVYSAQQALEAGLVDAVVYEEEAIEQAEELAEIDEAEIVEYRRKPTLGDLLFAGAFAGAPAAGSDDSLASLLAPLVRGTTGPHVLYFWPGGR